MATWNEGAVVALLAGSLVACGHSDLVQQEHDRETAIHERAVATEEAPESPRAEPFQGGTLLVSRDGSTAVAADPDRDQVFLVDLDRFEVTPVQLREGDRPGRLVEGPDGVFFVVVRGADGIIRLVSESQSVVRHAQLCGAPSGIDYDSSKDEVIVACRSGQLLNIEPSTLVPTRELHLQADLRDVVVHGGELVTTRFKAAQFTVIDEQGTIKPLQNLVAAPQGYTVNSGFRAVAVPGGGVAMVHQDSSTTTLGAAVAPATPSAAGATATPYYGGNPCTPPLARPSISLLEPVPTTTRDLLGTHSPQSLQITRHSLGSATGPLDLAISSDGERVALLAMGNNWSRFRPQPQLHVLSMEQVETELDASLTPCQGTPGAVQLEGQAAAVAFTPDGEYVVQSRQPALLQFESGRIVVLSEEPRKNSAFQLFYTNNGSGVSCASCHPAGEDDGHTWNFADFGARRTQTLTGGISRRAPFHWAGELDSFNALIEEVMVTRMGLEMPSEAALEGLQQWLDRLPVPDLASALDAEAVARGAAVFSDPEVGCASCHSGELYTDGQRHDVATGRPFVTPSLVGLGLRAPLMHDGCAPTLEDRFGECGGGDQHGVTSHLSAAELGDLTTFLRSL